jgi:hypothetical protein
MRAGFRSTLFLVLAVLCAALACSSSQAPSGPVPKGPQVIVPQDLVGLINSLVLKAYPATPDGGSAISCDETTGVISGNLSEVTPISFSDFTKTGCTSGSVFCTPPFNTKNKDPLVFPQGSAQVFSVTGYAPGGQTPQQEVAIGCSKVTLGKQTSESISITLVRYLPKAMCGNGKIEPTETCDDSTPACIACQTPEELLSYGSGSGTSMGSAAGQLTNPSFLWPSGGGISGSFLAVYSDATGSPLQIAARLMDETLSPPTQFHLADTSSIFVPSNGTFPPPASAFDLKQPSAALLGGSYYVAFSSDDPAASTGKDAFDIYYDTFAQSESLAGQGPCPVSSANSHINTLPSIAAGSGSSLYVAWQDDTGGANGRLITTTGSGCGTLGTQTILGSGIPTSSSTGPRVAATGSGWVVVWQSGGSVVMDLIDGSGNAAGQVTVGSGSNPVVASTTTSKGTVFAVAWANSSSPGGISMQRYDSSGNALGASATINTTAGKDGDVTPAIAGGSQAGGFYAVSWIDNPSTSGAAVRARLVSATAGALGDNSGYFFNTVDGTANDFPVNDSKVDGAARNPNPQNPTVAVGGAGYIAFGWEDKGATCSMTPSTFPGTPCYGIIGRRFPTPTE